jgi:hypothetical protein
MDFVKGRSQVFCYQTAGKQALLRGSDNPRPVKKPIPGRSFPRGYSNQRERICVWEREFVQGV